MTTNSFWHMMAGLLLGATLGHTAVLYTFSENGVNPYSFSFLEPSLLDATGAFAIPPFQVGSLTFAQATLTQAGGTGCFQFGTGRRDVNRNAFLFNAVSYGSAPAARDQLTITAQAEPASPMLLAGALAILAALALRRTTAPRLRGEATASTTSPRSAAQNRA